MTSNPPSRPTWAHTEHSTKELENRLTTLEVNSEDHGETIDHHSERLTLHERAILAILGTLYILLQDKFPAIADLLRGLVK
ncbi:hypothetical protein [uncultured Hyphomicrobium sp.]|uniref:DUF7365 family protein n=1 Tax=uncultured Hyphomicrobium sp. TaxID=194373 RepID=UPI0025F14FB7|nr:hypothetical protein [uncultured Hyphomicrobium sp.]